MRKVWRVSLALLALSAVCGASAPAVEGSAGRPFGTISGMVTDSQGHPLGGALVSLLKDGANEVVKQTRSGADGSFTARIAPGRYGLRAIADGFNEALFPSVDLHASDELVYRFNLEPAGSAKTAPEHRRDRDNPEWRLRAARNRRSIFQMQEGEDKTIEAALGADQIVDENSTVALGSADDHFKERHATQGVVETYAATSSNALLPSYVGLNFAIEEPVGERLSFVLAGQTGSPHAAPQRLDLTARMRAGDRHRLSLGFGGGLAPTILDPTKGVEERLGQLSVRAVDEWVIRDGVVIVMGLDYSRFVGASQSHSISPRIGLQYDLNARTRLRVAYAPGGERSAPQSEATFESGTVSFKQPLQEPVALVDGRAVMERSRRFEFGVERVLDNESSIEATAFFDTTTNRGVGLLSTPLSAFSGEAGLPLNAVANQQGAARGMRVVYTRHISRVWSASAGYSFGRGQRLSGEAATNPAEAFSDGFFQTAALQIGADLGSGTHVRTIFRFSPDATVFAIDPFAGRLAVYDPSLSILVTQELPTFGLPLRAEAVIDARNLFDVQASADNGDLLTLLNSARRSVRGGISVRF